MAELPNGVCGRSSTHQLARWLGERSPGNVAPKSILFVLPCATVGTRCCHVRVHLIKARQSPLTEIGVEVRSTSRDEIRFFHIMQLKAYEGVPNILDAQLGLKGFFIIRNGICLSFRLTLSLVVLPL